MDKKIKRKVKICNVCLDISDKALKSFIFLIISVIVWGIILFFFQDFKLIHKYTEIVDSITMFSLMYSFIMNSVLSLFAYIFFAIEFLTIKKLYKKQGCDLEIQNGQDTSAISTAYYESQLGNNETLQTASSVPMILSASKTLSSNREQIANLLGQDSPKITIYGFIILLMNILLSITFIGVVTGDAIYSRNFILTQRQNTINTINNIYSGMDVKSYKNKYEDNEYNVSYNEIEINFAINNYGKIQKITYICKQDTDINKIEETLNMLHSKLYNYEYIFLFPEMANSKLTLFNDISKSCGNKDECNLSKKIIVNNESNNKLKCDEENCDKYKDHINESLWIDKNNYNKFYYYITGTDYSWND